MSDPDKTLQLLEQPEYWILPIEESPVVRCIVDQGFTLQLGFHDITVNITLYADFEVSVGSEKRVFSSDRVDELGEVLTLLNKKIVMAKIYKTGTLELAFDDNRRLRIDPYEWYEAWHISTSKGSRIICMPSGELAIWT